MLTNSKHGGGYNNQVTPRKEKTLMIVSGIFALVIVTTAASFAFFTYSRVGNTKATIISGDIEFSYIEGDSAELVNAFPVADSIGAIDETGEYDFQVKLNSSGTTKANYNVYLVDNNDGENHFTNEQIKFALIKNDVFVANTSATEGVKLSEINGFAEGSHNGEGSVLEDQEISSGEVDNYKLRIWISDDVSYTNDYQTDGTMEGKYNSYTYSLKVKVTSGITNSITIGDITVNGSTITADISDPNGLSAYAVTTSSSTPSDEEWIEITRDTAKSNVVRTSTDLITSQTVSYQVSGSGTYYLHVKNKLSETKSKKIDVVVQEMLASTYIMNLAKTNTDELRIDTHTATGQQDFDVTEYRYYGKTPNNYVEFNGEMWRIIGVFDVDDGTGNIEKRLKIIRNESIGELAWDISTYNRNRGINEWSQADLNILLNEGDYYNRLNDYSSKGLTIEAKSMIGDAKWYLGAPTTREAYADSFYTYERSNIKGKGCTVGDNNYCTDTIARTKFWVGQVGLIYPSDYGYSGDLTKCNSLFSVNASCRNQFWLYEFGLYWSITPYRNDYASDVYRIAGTGTNYKKASYEYGVHPTVYLSPDVKIVGGTGESGANAFKLSK